MTLSMAQHDRVKRYDDAMDRAATAAIIIRRYTSRAQVKDEAIVTAQDVVDAQSLAKQLEAIVNEFGLELIA